MIVKPRTLGNAFTASKAIVVSIEEMSQAVAKALASFKYSRLLMFTAILR